MERKIDEQVNKYMSRFKEHIRREVLDDSKTVEKTIEEIFKFDEFKFDISSINKKKRVRNVIPNEERCVAYRADKDRCTRKKKDGCDVCGTHMKGTPHGVTNSTDTKVNIKKIEIFTQDIGGIIYYVDNDKNVYSSNDIMKNVNIPSVIGKYIIDGNGGCILTLN
jgi:hypothetical protein